MPCEGGRSSSLILNPGKYNLEASPVRHAKTEEKGDEPQQHTDAKVDEKMASIKMSQSVSTVHTEPLQEPTFQHRKTRERIRRAKKQHRSDIHWSEWSKFRYAESDFCEQSMNIKENIPRIYKEDTTHVGTLGLLCRLAVTAGQDAWIDGQKPVLLCGWMDDWPAMKKWDIDTLRRDYRAAKFKVGEKDNGDKIRMKMKYFIDYMKHQNDDSPLYLFESAVEDKANTCGLLNDWHVPDVFPVDLHAIVGEERRPPYRWFCIGPKRSGTTVHTDPLGTAAWNAVTSGYKRWALFPPNTSKQIVKGKHLMQPGEDDEPIMWFHNILPRIKERYPDIHVYEEESVLARRSVVATKVSLQEHHAQRPSFVAVLRVDMQCIQGPGENHFSFGFIDTAWRKLRKGRRRLAAQWFSRLKHFFPEKEVYGRLDLANKVDGWEVRSGKFCRVRASSGFATDMSSSSSSSGSSSSSASSDDEDELCELAQRVRQMRNAISKGSWQAYFQSPRGQTPKPRPLPHDTTPLARLTDTPKALHAEKRMKLL